MTLSDLGLILAVFAPPTVASIAAADVSSLRPLRVCMAGATAGFVVGGLLSLFIWIASVHVPTSWNLLVAPALGAAVGLIPASLVWLLYRLRARRTGIRARAV
jgi:hypothetical protein